MSGFDTPYTYYHLHTEEREKNGIHRKKFTMCNRSLVPYHQRPHWFHIVGRNALEQSCPIKTENKISCGFIHRWTKKCETWRLEEIKVFGIFLKCLVLESTETAHLNKQLLRIQGVLSRRKREITHANATVSCRKLLCLLYQCSEILQCWHWRVPSSPPRILWISSFISLHLIFLLHIKTFA